MFTQTLVMFIALAAIGFLVWLAYFLGFRGDRHGVGEAELLALTRSHGGAQHFLLDAGGSSAVALLHDGQLLAAKTVGARVATRVFPTSALASVKCYQAKITQKPGIELHFHDSGFSSLRVAMEESRLPAWLDQMQPEKDTK